MTVYNLPVTDAEEAALVAYTSKKGMTPDQYFSRVIIGNIAAQFASEEQATLEESVLRELRNPVKRKAIKEAAGL